MTPEAKKRKNQKKKLKQKQKKAAEKAASHSEEPLELPESTINSSFNDDSVNRTESDIASKFDVPPVSSSTNISPANETQLEIPDTQELHHKLLNDSDQHDITADSNDLPDNQSLNMTLLLPKQNQPCLKNTKRLLLTYLREIHRSM